MYIGVVGQNRKYNTLPIMKLRMKISSQLQVMCCLCFNTSSTPSITANTKIPEQTIGNINNSYLLESMQLNYQMPISTNKQKEPVLNLETN